MIEFKQLDSRAILPTRANPWDAGVDLTIIENVMVWSNKTTIASTGLAVAIPVGNVGFLCIRSGLGKKGVQLVNAPGVIDAGYRGEIKLMLRLQDSELRSMPLFEGERVAQLVITPFRTLSPTFVDELPVSDGREMAGFGSSGK